MKLNLHQFPQSTRDRRNR